MSEDGKDDEEINSLEQLLDRIEEAANEEDPVTVGEILEFVGRRSFGPLLLVTGIATLAPVIGDIPGVPTVLGVVVLIIAVQLLFRRDHFWMPELILKRSIDREKLCKVIGWFRKPARFVDRILRRRLSVFTKGPMVYVIAVLCIAIAAAMPVMEFVPFSANLAGLALTAFGLSLIAHDGLLAFLALCITAGTAVAVALNLP